MVPDPGAFSQRTTSNLKAQAPIPPLGSLSLQPARKLRPSWDGQRKILDELLQSRSTGAALGTEAIRAVRRRSDQFYSNSLLWHQILSKKLLQMLLLLITVMPFLTILRSPRRIAPEQNRRGRNGNEQPEHYQDWSAGTDCSPFSLSQAGP